MTARASRDPRRSTLTPEQYLTVQSRLAWLAEEVSELDIPAFLRAISRADAAGPIADPTLWMRGHKTMERFRRLAVAAETFRLAARQFRYGESR